MAIKLLAFLLTLAIGGAALSVGTPHADGGDDDSDGAVLTAALFDMGDATEGDVD